ncbi:MAG: tRNA uracil 4-sulfurtransferase ThiI [Patescibacteria group bacterium]|nr:tRNA uracil 4-sulfurtransferase ThiI [Patescibacteria group bacterium]
MLTLVMGQQQFIIRYAEIGLKGKNRIVFENQLVKNIYLALGKVLIIKQHKQFILTVKSNLINQTIVKLQQVFGIAWFAPVTIVAQTQAAIAAAALKLIKPHKTFAVRAHHDLEIAIGDIIRVKKKIRVDLSHPQQTIYITEFGTQAIIFNQKISGPGGLPVGTSGRVLCLLSGGFDSIAAAYVLSKRGAQVDFLHFHVYPNQRKVLVSKIMTIIEKLKIITLSQKLYLASYLPFQMKVLNLDSSDEKQDLVVYRRLMVKVAELIAKEHGYQVLILGDSLGQVASQTMENIVAVDQAVSIPIFRPLIGTDKKDIIDLVRQIGLYEEAITPYKDCCSLISTHPATIANLTKIQKIEKSIKIKSIINDIFINTHAITF